jgi:RimJ/RimL family protein N-acetyltransferase
VITLRSATVADADLLLAWANDPTTRAAGFHRGTIDPATHRRWLAARLASPASRLYIGLDGAGRPIGQLRLEAAPDGRVEIGISVAPEARGHGIGAELLRAGIQAGPHDPDLRVDVYVARIRPENVASIRLFTGAGFLHVGSEDVAGAEALVYELPAG